MRPPFLFGSDVDDGIEDSGAESGWTEFTAALIVFLGALLQSNVFVLLRMLRGKLTTFTDKGLLLTPRYRFELH